uniref:Uncharacterized protein n=1 Tax=Oryza brachyantha TaxID=4533 RepID=J3N8Q4_ORYBR
IIYLPERVNSHHIIRAPSLTTESPSCLSGSQSHDAATDSFTVLLTTDNIDQTHNLRLHESIDSVWHC